MLHCFHSNFQYKNLVVFMTTNRTPVEQVLHIGCGYHDKKCDHIMLLEIGNQSDMFDCYVKMYIIAAFECLSCLMLKYSKMYLLVTPLCYKQLDCCVLVLYVDLYCWVLYYDRLQLWQRTLIWLFLWQSVVSLHAWCPYM